jgi:hypothetical protein
MGYSIERNGLPIMQKVVQAVVADMLYAGFKLIAPTDVAMIADPATTYYIVEAGPDVDPLAEEQPWRILLEPLSEDELQIYVATPLQIIEADGAYEVAQTYESTQQEKAYSGDLANRDATQIKSSFVKRGAATTGGPGWTTKLTSYINLYIGTDPDTGLPLGGGYPYSYRLSVSDHGVALCIWYEASDPFGECFSWFVVQRPVHPKTGMPLLNGKCPLFCVYSLQGGGRTNEVEPVLDHKTIMAFTVRERDVNTTAIQHSAVVHNKYGAAMINHLPQITFTEDNEYIINFPNNLTTNRYAYIHELDMIGYTSAGAISQWTIAEVNMYGEKNPDDTPLKRKYQALQANEPLNMGMRILMLIDGGGVVYGGPDIPTSIGTHPPMPTPPPTTPAPTTPAP